MKGFSKRFSEELKNRKTEAARGEIFGNVPDTISTYRGAVNIAKEEDLPTALRPIADKVLAVAKEGEKVDEEFMKAVEAYNQRHEKIREDAEAKFKVAEKAINEAFFQLRLQAEINGSDEGIRKAVQDFLILKVA